jgi:hypothetical protein
VVVDFELAMVMPSLPVMVIERAMQRSALVCYK